MSDPSGRERPRARALAFTADNELTAIIEAIMDGVFIYSADGRLRIVNSAGRRLLAIDRQPDYATTPIAERVPLLAPLDDQGRPLPSDRWPAQRVLRGEELRADHAAEVRVRAFDGRLVDLSVSGAPLRDEVGQVIGGVTIMRDVTARRRMERRSHDALNALLEMAEALVTLPSAPAEVAPDEVDDAEDAEDAEDADRVEASAHADAAVEVGASSPMQRAVGHGARRDAAAPDTETGERAEIEPVTRLAWLIRSVLGLQRVGVLLTQPDDGALTPAAIVGLAPAEEQRARAWLNNATFSDLAPDLALRARLHADEPVALDVRRADNGYDTAALTPFGARRVVIAPMRIGRRLIGLLILGADEADAGDAGDAGPMSDDVAAPDDAHAVGALPTELLTLASAVAHMAALVIERERLIHDRAEERAHRIALSNANERMDEFLATASHELKSPLTAIKANVQLARRRLRRMSTPDLLPAPVVDAPVAPVAEGAESGAAPDDARAMALELLQRTEEQITRLNRLVDDLLDTSRIQAGKLTLRPAPCDLIQLARDVVEEQRQSQPARTITFDAPAQAVMALADADRVRQVITNYVTNALKYSPADRPVAVALSVARRRARLMVRDEGPGLPPDEQTRIWERFHRAPGVEDLGGTGVGLGLGLHISRTLIARMGGQVGVESVVGQGSTFWFTLPLARPTADQ